QAGGGQLLEPPPPVRGRGGYLLESGHGSRHIVREDRGDRPGVGASGRTDDRRWHRQPGYPARPSMRDPRRLLTRVKSSPASRRWSAAGIRATAWLRSSSPWVTYGRISVCS